MINKEHITKFLYCVIFLFSSLIFIKLGDKNKESYYKLFYYSSFSFTKFNSFISNHFGNVIPKANSNVVSVMNESIYNNYEDFLDGVKFWVNNNTPVNSLIGGIVVYKGEKDGYGNCVIIQGVNGNDYWYGNITNSNLNLYEYVNKNSIIGESNGDYFYLVIKNKTGFIKYAENKN